MLSDINDVSYIIAGAATLQALSATENIKKYLLFHTNNAKNMKIVEIVENKHKMYGNNNRLSVIVKQIATINGKTGGRY
jgi:hypothetical protein